jgi:hypothetical protein
MRLMALDEQRLQRALPTTELKLHQSEIGTIVVFDLSKDADYEPLLVFLNNSHIDSEN